MRGARRLGALFLFVASLVAALKSDELVKSGFTATTDRDGNPVYNKGDNNIATASAPTGRRVTRKSARP